MDTWVLSDLHLAVNQPESLYAGGEALPRWLARLAAAGVPVRIVFNGDTFDFLSEEGELRLDAEAARASLLRATQHPLIHESLRLLGEIMASGGEVVVRLGNHDLELALPAVQSVLRQALQQPADVATRLLIVHGDAPSYLRIGGLRVLVTHGEHDDPFNRIDYPRLLSAVHDPLQATQPFVYPAGSLLMRRIVAPIRQRYGLRFLDFLKPDFQGAALVALAIAPEACRELFQKATWDIGWQLVGHTTADVSFAVDLNDEVDLGLYGRLLQADLSEDDQQELGQWALASDSAQAFAAEALSSRLRSRLLQAGLSLYAHCHRWLAGRAGAAFFDTAPSKEEASWAAQLAARHGCEVVLTGHTHAARFLDQPDVTYVNSGTWMWLLRLPAPTAPLAEWTAWLAELRQNPSLDPALQASVCPERRLSLIQVRPQPEGGARICLLECQEDGSLVEVCATTRSPAADRGGSHVQRPSTHLSK